MSELLFRWRARDFEPPQGANYAAIGVRQTALNTTRVTIVQRFAAGEISDIGDIMPDNYGGSDLQVVVEWLAQTATSGTVIWGCTFFPEVDETTDLDLDHYVDVGTWPRATGTAPSNSGTPQYTTISVTAAELNGVVAGQGCMFRLEFIGGTMSGNAEVVSLRVIEP